MMKKLLILILVLGMTSVAGAALWAVEPVVDGIVTWDVISDQLVGHGDSLGTYDGLVCTISGGTITPAPGGIRPAAGDAGDIGLGPDCWYCYAGDLNLEVPPNQEIGDWFVFDIAFTGPEMIVEFWNARNGWVEPVGTMTIVPEPMTIALLGLGGLLLRRRK